MSAAIRIWCLATLEVAQKLAYAALVLYGGYCIVRDLRMMLGGGA